MRRTNALIRYTGLWVSVAIATSFSNVAHAGAGVWTSGGPYGGHVMALAINPRTPTTLYAGTWFNGVFKSTNSGGTWAAANTGLTSLTVWALAINPTTPATLYAGTYGGVFKSTNSGGTWAAANTGLGNLNIFALAINPTTSATLYAGTDARGVFKSTNSGGTWAAANTGLTNLTVQALAINPTTSATLYAGTPGGGVFKSTDSGGTWAVANTGLTNLTVQALAINPTTSATLYAGSPGGGVFKSTNSGGSWAAVNTGLTNLTVRTLAINPTTPATLYAGTDGGVFKSTDSGGTWAAANTGLTNLYVQALALDPTGATTLYAGLADGSVWEATGTVQTGCTVPIVLSSAGIGSSFYTSELALTNKGGTTATVSYTYTGSLEGGGGTATDTLPPGTQKIVPDAISYLRGLRMPIPASGNRGGALRADFSNTAAARDLAITARTTTPVAGGRAGLAYPAVAAANALTGGAVVGGLRQNATDRSNLALVNMGELSEGAITLHVSLHSGASTPVDLPEKTLAPGQFLQLTEVLTGFSATQGWARIERVAGSAPWYAYGVVNDQHNSDGSFIPPLADGALASVNAVDVPAIVETPTFTSELAISNTTTLTRTVQLAYVADAITNPGNVASVSLTLGPSEQRIIPSFVAWLRQQGVAGIPPAGPTFVGALFATAAAGDLSGIFVGARTSTPGGGGEFGVFYTAVPVPLAAADAAYVYDLRQDGENRSNLAILNTGAIDGGDDSLRVDLYSGAGGALAGSTTVKVGARHFVQIDRILAGFTAGVTNGWAKVSRVAGTNPFITYGVINDGANPGERTGDGSYVAGVPAAAGGPSPATFQLLVTLAGTGSGRVVSVPAGIDCPAPGAMGCLASFPPGTPVTLSATPSGGSSFGGWGGGCTGSGSCALTLTADTVISGSFTQQPSSQPNLTVLLLGTGNGTITSSPSGIICVPTCSGSYASGTVVILTATPTSGSTFAGWSDACSGAATTCTVTMDANKSVTATFNAHVLESVSQLIVAATGGAMRLPSGSSVTIPPGALASDQMVTLSLTSELRQPPLSGMIQGVGPALSLSFGTNEPFAGTTQQQGVQFVIKYGATPPARLSGSIPITDIVDDDNYAALVPIPCAADSTCTVVPINAIQAFPVTPRIQVSAANTATDGVPFPQLGDKTWNGTTWDQGVFSIDASKRYLILVHGMMSATEEAFGDRNCVEGIRRASGYDEVLGFDYDWSQSVDENGAALSRFMTLLKAARVQGVDIEAHSEGGPVSLSALCRNNDLAVRNLVMLGSPVTGTPAANVGTIAQGAFANGAINPLGTVFVNLPSRYLTPGGQTAQELLSGPFAQDLRPGSNVLNYNNACVAAKMHQATSNLSGTQIVGVGGSDYTASWDMLTLGTILSALHVFGGAPFDGVVSTWGAMCQGAGFDPARVKATSFPLSHTRLECDPQVAAWVGEVVKAHAPICGASTIQIAGRVTDSSSGRAIVGASLLVVWNTTHLAAVSLSDGSYTLCLPNSLRDQTASVILQASGPQFVDKAVSIDLTLGNQTIDVALDPLSDAVIIVEVALHHLGDSIFQTPINAGLQTLTAEGVSFSKAFSVRSSQLPSNFTRASLEITVNGAESSDPVTLNGIEIAQLNNSAPGPQAFSVPFNISLLRNGTNTLAIASVDDGSGFDDFEFANVSIKLTK